MNQCIPLIVHDNNNTNSSQNSTGNLHVTNINTVCDGNNNNNNKVDSSLSGDVNDLPDAGGSSCDINFYSHTSLFTCLT